MYINNDNNNNGNNQSNYNYNQNQQLYRAEQIYQENIVSQGFTQFMTKVFAIVALGIFVSFGVSFVIYENIFKILIFLGNGFRFAFYGIFIVQIIVVLVLSHKIKKGIALSTGLALFIFYSVLTGITFSVIGIAFSPSEIMHALLVCALFFTALCIVGHITDYKLLTYGRMIGFALIFFLIVQVISMLFFPGFLSSPIFDLIGIGIFSFYTVYDFQSIKYSYSVSTSESQKQGVMIGGALQLYLDFVNLFIYLLRLLSRKN